jgi:CBS domain-containing protein
MRIRLGWRKFGRTLGRTAMKVAEVMTRGVISIAPTDSMRKAAQLMLQYDMSGFPVMDRGKLAGIVTEGDFLRRAEIGTERPRIRWIELLTDPGQLAEDYAHAHGRKVEEVMTREVVTVAEDASLEDVVRLMERHRIKRLPVVKGDAVVGIISRANLLHAFIVGSPKAATALVRDAAIRGALVATLDKEPWSAHVVFNAIVENGIVDFDGVIRDERQRVALRIAAENIPGVKAVRDHRLKLDPGAAG